MATLRVESIAAGGDGIGRLDGLAVFVPRTAPGELVEVAVRTKGRMGKGRLLGIVEPSPDRVAPRCRHYDGDRCGGCQVQHLSIAAQREAKRRIVGDAFARIARRTVDVPPVVESPHEWGYRSRLTLAMRRIEGRWIFGLHRYDDVDHVFDLGECPITDDRVVSAWKEIHGVAGLLPLAPELRGTVRLAGDDLAFVVEGGTAWPTARAFGEALSSFGVIRWRPVDGAMRVVLDRRTHGTPEESFDQVNQPVATLARAEIVARAMAVNPATVVDAYAGLGMTTRALGGQGVAVTAIELDGVAARYAASRAPGARVLAGRVEDLLPRCLPADVVIVNPPRAGLHERVPQVLQVAPRPRRLLYMSCDPATLARDVSRLPGWRVTSVRAYDMFPQTAHVEVVCELTPEDA